MGAARRRVLTVGAARLGGDCSEIAACACDCSVWIRFFLAWYSARHVIGAVVFVGLDSMQRSKYATFWCNVWIPCTFQSGHLLAPFFLDYAPHTCLNMRMCSA